MVSPLAGLFTHVLYHYRRDHNYLLHEYVVMPNHFHLLITPLVCLERALQLIKGGFSYRAKRELSVRDVIWETSFYDRRVRNDLEYERMRSYIRANPVRRGLAVRPEDYPYSSANPKWPLDEVPQRLKPQELTSA